MARMDRKATVVVVDGPLPRGGGCPGTAAGQLVHPARHHPGGSPRVRPAGGGGVRRRGFVVGRSFSGRSAGDGRGRIRCGVARPADRLQPLPRPLLLGRVRRRARARTSPHLAGCGRRERARPGRHRCGDPSTVDPPADVANATAGPGRARGHRPDGARLRGLGGVVGGCRVAGGPSLGASPPGRCAGRHRGCRRVRRPSSPPPVGPPRRGVEQGPQCRRVRRCDAGARAPHP